MSDNLQLANEQQASEMNEISDAMYDTLVQHTHDVSIGLSAIATLLAKTLLRISDSEQGALETFRKRGIPIIEQTILGGLKYKGERVN